MRHRWERNGLCLYCGWFCDYCNDCACPGNGWTRYRTSRCPGFDTEAGRLRPHPNLYTGWSWGSDDVYLPLAYA